MPEIKVPAEVARKQFERYGHEFGRAEDLYQRYMHDEVVRGERDAMANSFSGEKVMFLQTETSTLIYIANSEKMNYDGNRTAGNPSKQDVVRVQR